MWQTMKTVIKDCITCSDGVSYDLGRILWAMAFIVGVALECYCASTGKAFDLQQYGIGIGALLVAGGASLGLKSKTEPQS